MNRVLLTIAALGCVTLPALAAQQFQVSRASQATEYVYSGVGGVDPGQIHQATMTATAQAQAGGFHVAMMACAGGRMMSYYVSMPSCSSSGSAVTCTAQVNVTCMR